MLFGCACYAVSNIGQELIVKGYDRLEFLAMLGLFGTVCSGFTMGVAEHQVLRDLPWAGTTMCSRGSNAGHVHVTIVSCLIEGRFWAYLVGFTLCLLAIYGSVPTLLRLSRYVVTDRARLAYRAGGLTCFGVTVVLCAAVLL